MYLQFLFQIGKFLEETGKRTRVLELANDFDSDVTMGRALIVFGLHFLDRVAMKFG